MDKRFKSKKFLKLCEIIVDGESDPIVKWIIPANLHTRRLPVVREDI